MHSSVKKRRHGTSIGVTFGNPYSDEIPTLKQYSKVSLAIQINTSACSACTSIGSNIYSAF